MLPCLGRKAPFTQLRSSERPSRGSESASALSDVFALALRCPNCLEPRSIAIAGAPTQLIFGQMQSQLLSLSHPSSGLGSHTNPMPKQSGQSRSGYFAPCLRAFSQLCFINEFNISKCCSRSHASITSPLCCLSGCFMRDRDSRQSPNRRVPEICGSPQTDYPPLPIRPRLQSQVDSQVDILRPLPQSHRRSGLAYSQANPLHSPESN
jgi:hypothetical protein